MKINVNEFLEILESVQSGLAKKEVIEQSTCFIFDQGEIITYNDQVTVSCPIDIDIDGAVIAEELIKLLRQLPDEEVEIKTTRSELRINGKKSRAGIRLQEEINLPIDEIELPKKWKTVPKGFLDALNFCSFNVATDLSKPILSNVHVNGKSIEATDNFRMTQVILGSDAEKIFKKPILIPGSCIVHLKSHNPNKFNVLDGWIHFQNEKEVIFSTRIYEEEFPDISKFFKVKGSTIKMPEGIEEILERVNIFIDSTFEQDKRVDLTLTKNKLFVRGEGSVGWFEEHVRIKHDGNEINFAINPKFLLESLKLLDEMVIGERTMKLKGKGFSHVAMLIAN